MNIGNVLNWANAILLEGFKDLANMYKVTPQDQQYNDLKTAYATINQNPKLKDYYKRQLGNISNFDQGLFKKFGTVDAFLSAYEQYANTYEEDTAKQMEERRSQKLAQERQQLINKYAYNVVEETSEYIVYKVNTFEEAKEMRWLWMGNVPKYTNAQCQEFDKNAPADSQSYRGNMSAEDMAKYIMTNDKFIMNPSWCVCAGEHHWNDYDLDPDDIGDEFDYAKCHLIFSKKYPNARFCVVTSNVDQLEGEREVRVTVGDDCLEVQDDYDDEWTHYHIEIRDPWQVAGFGGDIEIGYGLAVMKEIFGEGITYVGCIADAEYDAGKAQEGTSASIDDFTDGDDILDILDYEPDLRELESLEQDFPKLVRAGDLFRDCALKRVNMELDSLEDGNNMFAGCVNLSYVQLYIPNLKKAKGMFEGCIITNLEALVNMFPSIPAGKANEETGDGIVDIGVRSDTSDDDIEWAEWTLGSKGWKARITKNDY